MDPHALAVLELPAVQARLADATSFSAGRALADALAPSGTRRVVEDRQRRTAEALRLLAVAEPRFGGAADVRATAERAARGGMLPAAALAGVARTLRCAIDVRSTIDAQAAAAPLLASRASMIDWTLSVVAQRIDAAVDHDADDLRDEASSELARLRRELRDARGRAAEHLRALAASSELKPHLQEGFVTERGGRPVLAVKASARSKVPGIVHDTSGSGQTLFVEPFAVVEMQNRLRELTAAEREEVERILTELTEAVGLRADAVADAVDALADIDLALACAKLSRGWGGCPVQVSERVLVEQARHPLLDRATAVPVDLDLGRLRGVVISGANTGGKTVSLKTLGLVALLHQCGLQPPAARAELPVFDQVLADIGDEQSIERSLSTFSGHIGNLVGILRAATDRSLVLLDEVAAGTDPEEGGALAAAILARLAGQARLVLTTTHYGALKEWASETTGVENAAVGFDPETLAPTFSLQLGRPGASHALQIAARLGLDAGVIAAARDAVQPERLQVADLLDEAANAERDAARARREAEALRAEATASRDAAAARERELTEAVEAARAGAKAERERARAEAEAELASYRRELAALREEIRAARRAERERQEHAPRDRDPLGSERDRRLDEASSGVRRAQGALDRAFAEPELQLAPLAVGDPVQAPALGVRGTIAEIRGEDAEILGPGGLRVRVPVARLLPDAAARTTLREERPVSVHSYSVAPVEAELDVRGRRADEAREAVRAYIDAAHMTGRPEVVVIHGRGTGAVRKAVRDELARHPLVETTATQSADGATRVVLHPLQG